MLNLVDEYSNHKRIAKRVPGIGHRISALASLLDKNVTEVG